MDGKKGQRFHEQQNRRDGDKSDGYKELARMMCKSMANPLEST